MDKRGRAEAILAEVTSAVERWSDFAAEAGVEPASAAAIRRQHRLTFARG